MDALNAGTIFYQWLVTFPEITQVVGDRIYPTIPDQDEAFPLLVYAQTGHEPPMKMIGMNGTPDKFRTSYAQIQLTVRGNTLSEVNNVVSIISEKINGKGNGGSIRLAQIVDSSVDGDLDGDNQVLFVKLQIRQNP